MSAVRGGGAGCYARHDTLAKTAGTDATNFSKSLSRLIERGYVMREQQSQDRRRSTLRVRFEPLDSWPDDQPYSGAERGDWRNDQLSGLGEEVGFGGGVIDGSDRAPDEQMLDGDTNNADEMVGPGDSGNGSFSKADARDYIPLNGKLDSDKSALGSDCVTPASVRTNFQRSLRHHLPSNFDTLPSGARVSKLEKAFNAIGRDPSTIPAPEAMILMRDLNGISLAEAGTPTGEQALRLFEEMSP